jgi:gamma-glutamyltranspeptidase/glutathione hydrolase
MALNILSQTQVSQYTHLGAEHIHLLSESVSLASAERDRHVADPTFNRLPVEALLSPSFAARQYERIKPHRASPQPIESALLDHKDTGYLAVVDKDRNACSLVTTHPAWAIRSGRRRKYVLLGLALASLPKTLPPQIAHAGFLWHG